jgi:uncharacterized protein (UPF0333 family)
MDESNAEELMFNSRPPKSILDYKLIILAVIVVLIVVFMCTSSASQETYNEMKDINPVTPEMDTDHYNDDPDKKYNVTYKYEEQKDNVIKSDPGENVLFSVAHGHVMEDYPV